MLKTIKYSLREIRKDFKSIHKRITCRHTKLRDTSPKDKYVDIFMLGKIFSIKCKDCGKQFTIVRYNGFDMESYIYMEELNNKSK